MKWTVTITSRAAKQVRQLPANIQAGFAALADDLATGGPVARDWPRYGTIKGKTDCYHCHLNKGKPRYVAVWEQVDSDSRTIEVRYVGTHEKTRYGHICRD